MCPLLSVVCVTGPGVGPSDAAPVQKTPGVGILMHVAALAAALALIAFLVTAGLYYRKRSSSRSLTSQTERHDTILYGVNGPFTFNRVADNFAYTASQSQLSSQSTPGVVQDSSNGYGTNYNRSMDGFPKHI